jgi:DNA-binding response OmpR family regulator
MSQRIVVCDDEPHIVRAISLKFARAGFDVQGASDAEACLELLRKNTPTLLITDYTMPGMNGAQMVRRIRANEAMADLPVIMLTARGFELAEQTGELDGLRLSAIVTKPFSPRELVVKVYEILGYEIEPATSAFRDSFSSV